MWKTLSEWLLAFLNMARELQENRMAIRRLEERSRDAEEAIRLLAQELRHTREVEATEREKLLLRLEQRLPLARPTPTSKRRKKR